MKNKTIIADRYKFIEKSVPIMDLIHTIYKGCYSQAQKKPFETNRKIIEELNTM